jgi:bifunctional DNA-binding transcriptional regulator/antitoxin component of YhaV-PrlF toxin-antitoxin module
MAKSNLSDRVIAIVLLIIAVAGCKQLQSLKNPTVLKSADGKFQLTVPAGWREHGGLNDKADIKAASLINEMYVIVITEAKLDFTDEMTLDQYTTITRDSMVSNLASSDATPPVPVTINGNAGRQYEIQGAVKNVKLAYLVTTVETAAHYHQIITWTLRSRINENQMTLQQVTETFRPTPGQGIRPGSP